MIERLWASFGDGTPEIARQHIVLWTHCLDVGAELQKQPSFRRAQSAFLVDVQNGAQSTLDKNREYIADELTAIGADGPSVAADEKLAEIQRMARLVREARVQESALRRLPVGEELEVTADGLPYWSTLTFDPLNVPGRNLDRDGDDPQRD